MVDRAGSGKPAPVPDRGPSRAESPVEADVASPIEAGAEPDGHERRSEPAPQAERLRPAPRKAAVVPARQRPPVPIHDHGAEPVVESPREESTAQHAPAANALAAAHAAGGGDPRPPAGGAGGRPAEASGPHLAAHQPGMPGMGADLRPWCRNCPVPDYPARARRRGWQGTVEVDLDLNGDGSVQEARVVRSSGFPALDQAAVAVARRSRFRVSAAGGALRGKLRYQFRLERSL